MKQFVIRDLIKLLLLEHWFAKRNVLEQNKDAEELQEHKEQRDKERSTDTPIRENIPKSTEAIQQESDEAPYYSSSNLKKSALNPAHYVPFDGYTQSLIGKRHDFSNNVPTKNLTWQPKSMMGGVLGYTYLGAGTINKRDDLVFNPALSYEVDVHESIHTEWEYETRVLTSWMLADDPYFLKY